MLSVLSDFSVEQLQDKEGRQAVLDQLRDAMNAKLEELEGFGGVEEFILHPLWCNRGKEL